MNNSTQFPSVTVIVTLLNEVGTIDELMESLLSQSVIPKKIVITDGGSTDGTWKHLLAWKQKRLPVELIIEQAGGNRSKGRNRAVAVATTDLIACTDAGCIPEKDWLKELLKAQKKSGAQVVAGFYKGLPQNNFQTAQIPYVLVMPNNVNSSSFLPATRSMLFNRVWFIKNGGFDENLSDNEDYALARKIRNLQQSFRTKILSFTSRAIVGWRPRSTLRQFAWMIFRFARGDARARLWRPKVAFIFVRYILFLCFVISALLLQSFLLIITGLSVVCAYVLWSIVKNYRYAKSAWYWLPILQVTSDIAVISGTIAGLAQSYVEKLCRLEKLGKKKNF